MRRLAFCLISVLLSYIPAAQADSEGARHYVDSVGQKVVAILDSGTGDAQKQQLQAFFVDNVDLEWMAKFVLGRGMQQATEQEKRQYIEAYKRYMLARYTTNFADYNGSKYKITGVQNQGNGDYMVQMTINTPKADEKEVDAGYRVQEENGSYRIHDIIIEGVSQITTQRQEFASVLQQGGMPRLISLLQQKTAQAAKS